MKNYRITVNGNVYDVAVEEVGGAVGNGYVAPSYAAAPVAMPTPSAPAVSSANVGAGAIKITSPMPGKILSVKTSVGAAVKKGDVLMVLEAMKMENEIVASQDGTVASVDVSEGAAVESGTILASLN